MERANNVIALSGSNPFPFSFRGVKAANTLPVADDAFQRGFAYNMLTDRGKQVIKSLVEKKKSEEAGYPLMDESDLELEPMARSESRGRIAKPKKCPNMRTWFHGKPKSDRYKNKKRTTIRKYAAWVHMSC